ncbi:MAG: 30S ribosomal protein S16 [Desulfomonile sp.]|nr:30S ribosomal protein S16 [Deltaproteobacteria bacterium]
MSVRIRLARYGAKKKPFYRVVAADSRFARDGRFLEVLGTYDPRNKLSGLNLNLDKIRAWDLRGAEFTTTVKKLIKQSESRKSPSE